MKVIKSIIIVAIITISFVYAGTSEILNPKTNVYDFTYNNVQQNSNTYNNGTIIAKVAYEIESTLALLPRTFKVESCPADSYGNRYCPEALSTASNIWTYDQSQVVEQKQYVTDYEQGTWKEFTSTVRDFMDGFASSHASSVTDYQSGWGTANVGTVVDYQSNSTASTYTGAVIDFTNKIQISQPASMVTTIANPINLVITYANNDIYNTNLGYQILSVKGLEDCGEYFGICGGTTSSTKRFYKNGNVSVNREYQYGTYEITRKCDSETQEISIVNSVITVKVPKAGNAYYNATLNGEIIGVDGYSDCGDYYGLCGTTKRHVKFYKNGTIYVNEEYQYGTYYVHLQTNSTIYKCLYYTCPTDTSSYILDITTGVCYSNKCPDTYQDNGTNCQKTVNYNYYSYGCPSTYTPVNSGFTSYSKSDPDASKINDYTLDDAVNSSTPPTSNCKKTITYSYYNYNCPADYTKSNNGLTMCSKTDPNNTTNDESSLSLACNNSTPPTGNCTKIIPYTYYSYECSDGYTAIDKGLATCNKTDSSTTADNSTTLDDSCNSATTPKENCYKDVSYKYYSYGCSAGYITDNYGLSNCPKTDPNKSINNSDSLDDSCNSATPPVGNCRKEVQYSFYKYVCNGVNEFGEPYYPINSGLSSCTKTDTNKNTVDGSTLDDPCNNDTVASNNCRAQAYTCNSSIITPALVNGTWQCSPYPCNSENKCGTAVCNDYTPSDTYYMPSNLSPIKAEYTGTCKGALCDAVINNKISYCQKFACPSQPGVYEKDGKCWYDECPVGTYVDANGNCVQK